MAALRQIVEHCITPPRPVEPRVERLEEVIVSHRLDVVGVVVVGTGSWDEYAFMEIDDVESL